MSFAAFPVNTFPDRLSDWIKEQQMTAKGDIGQAEVQKRKDTEEEQGFFGTEVDPTPNEHYTVAGVTSGKPTPETDEKQAAKARQA